MCGDLSFSRYWSKIIIIMRTAQHGRRWQRPRPRAGSAQSHMSDHLLSRMWKIMNTARVSAVIPKSISTAEVQPTEDMSSTASALTATHAQAGPQRRTYKPCVTCVHSLSNKQVCSVRGRSIVGGADRLLLGNAAHVNIIHQNINFPMQDQSRTKTRNPLVYPPLRFIPISASANPPLRRSFEPASEGDHPPPILLRLLLSSSPQDNYILRSK